MTAGHPSTTFGPQADSLGRSAQDSQSGERTPWLLAFLCLLIPILPSNSVPQGPLKSNGSPAKLIAIMFFGLALLGFVLIRRTARTRSVYPGKVILLVYFLLSLLVYGVGMSHLGSPLVEATKTRAILILLANVGVSLYIMMRVETMRQRTILLGCLAIGLTFNCVVGFLQPLHIDLHLLLQPPGFVVNAGDQGRGGAVILTERFGAQRAFGTATHAIEFSVVAAVAVPLTIHFARYGANRQVRLLAALACCVALVAMPAGVSRSGVVALTAALLVYMWTFKVRQLGFAVVAGAVALFIEFAAFPNTIQALWKTVANAREDGSVMERLDDYTTVSRTFHDNPVFGIGLGASPPAEYGFLDNEWLQALVQGGGVGLAAMIVLAGGGIFGLSAALRGATTRRERDQAYMMGSMLIGILASSLTFDLFTFQQATLLFFILFGLLWSNYTISVPEARITRTEAKRASFG